MLSGITQTPQEVMPGVHHWRSFNPEVDELVSSYYVEPAAALIDPMVPAAGLEWFDRFDVAPQQALLTSHDHWRESSRFAEAFDCVVRLHHRGLALLEEGRRAQPFNDADEVAPGVRTIEIGKMKQRPDETAFAVDAGAGAIAFGHALYRPTGGPLAFPPAAELGAHPDRVHEGLRDAFRGILLRAFDALLFTHGEPMTNGGHAALRKFCELPVGKPEFGDTL